MQDDGRHFAPGPGSDTLPLPEIPEPSEPEIPEERDWDDTADDVMEAPTGGPLHGEDPGSQDW